MTSLLDPQTYRLATILVPACFFALVALAAGDQGSSKAGARPASPETYDEGALNDLSDRADWAHLETQSRKIVDQLDRDPKSDQLAVASALQHLAYALENEGKYQAAESDYSRSLDIRRRLLNEKDPLTQQSLNNLGELLISKGDYAAAEAALNHLVDVEKRAIAEGIRDDEDDTVAIFLANLADAEQNLGKDEIAERRYREALTSLERYSSSVNMDTATVLNDLATLLSGEGRGVETEALYKRALAIYETNYGRTHPKLAALENNLANFYIAQDRYTDAAPLLRRALAIEQGEHIPEQPTTRNTLIIAAKFANAQGDFATAEKFASEALRMDEAIAEVDQSPVAEHLRILGVVQLNERRHAEAEKNLRLALSKLAGMSGPHDADVALSREELAFLELDKSDFRGATEDFRKACNLRSQVQDTHVATEEVQHGGLVLVGDCSRWLARSLWHLSKQTGGASATSSDAMRIEAFEAAQRTIMSSAGAALSRSAALKVASKAGAGKQAEEYETALSERRSLNQHFAAAAEIQGAPGVSERQALSQANAKVASRVAESAKALKSASPSYWQYRSSEAVPASALMQRASKLLHGDEALVLWMTPPDDARGLVFAVSNTAIGWAEIPLTGRQLFDDVRSLRKQLDPCGYDQKPQACGSAPKGFDRQTSYDLFRALLGASEIQAVIRAKSTLVIVPSGALTALPPGILITEPPGPQLPGDSESDVFRQTAWLLRTKAVAVLPSVSSLRALREFFPRNRAQPSSRLLSFADPDFNDKWEAEERERIKGHGAVGCPSVRSAPLESSLASPDALMAVLDNLPPLPCTRVESEALVAGLRVPEDSQLLGPRANKAELFARSSDGRLQTARVVLFATHGLIAGQTTAAIEPALVLAGRGAPERRILTASDAATLKMNADWVILSACNTAAPEASESQGISGLARAFFYAGAKSLLISHWRVRDDVASELVPNIVLSAGLTKAQAVQAASLAILDGKVAEIRNAKDPISRRAFANNLAHPSAWAAFELVGDPD